MQTTFVVIGALKGLTKVQYVTFQSMLPFCYVFACLFFFAAHKALRTATGSINDLV